MADLHLHLYGCVRPSDLLRHLAGADGVLWEWYESEMEAAYGAVPPARELVERFRRGEPDAAVEFEKASVVGDDAGSFARFSAKAKLWFAGRYLGDDPSLQAREVLGFAEGIRAGLVRQGVGYAEFRYSPYPPLLAAYDNDPEGPVQRLAVSLPREDPWPEWELVKEHALGPHGTALTGVDFCGIEEGHPPKDQATLFAAVRSFNDEHPERALAILYHVGESFGDKSLESAVRWVHEAAEMGAHRLGHAIALGVDPLLFGAHTRHESVAERRDQIAYDLHHQTGLEAAGVLIDREGLLNELSMLVSEPDDGLLPAAYDSSRLAELRHRQDYAMRCVRRTGAVVEVCPTSNRRVAGIRDAAHHPVHRFLGAGLPTVVASDDPGMFGITLMDELDWVVRHTGGGEDLRRHLIETAAESRSECLVGREPASGRRRSGGAASTPHHR